MWDPSRTLDITINGQGRDHHDTTFDNLIEVTDLAHVGMRIQLRNDLHYQRFEGGARGAAGAEDLDSH